MSLPSKFLLLLLGFLGASILSAQTSPIEDYNSTKTYSTGALVLVGQNSYIAIQSVPASTTPPNTTYWTNLSVAATSLQVPLETVPTLSTATILQSLPNSAPSDDNSSNISKLLGISTRGLVSSSMPMYGSVAITGSQSKKVAFMGKGQTMAAQGVTNYIADPVIEIWRVGSSGSWEVYKTNDNWGDASGTESISTVSGETGITVPVGTTESAIVLTLDRATTRPFSNPSQLPRRKVWLKPMKFPNPE